MSTISSEGLAQEQRVEAELCAKYTTQLTPRSITPEKLTAHIAAVADMEAKRELASNAGSVKEQLTLQEADGRFKLSKQLRALQEAVKKQFGINSPQAKEFYVGQDLTNSTKVIVAWANDMVNKWPTYKEQLGNQGIIQGDIDAIKASADALGALDAKQETAKDAAKEATQAFNDAMDNVAKIADSIQSGAKMAFANNAAVKDEFDAAKRLRYSTPAREKKPNPAPVAAVAASTVGK
jgi:hypothetical protein